MRRSPALRIVSAVRRIALLLFAVCVAAAPLAAQTSKAQIPALYDPERRLTKPDPEMVKSIRFLTTDDFPPFHFALADGTLTGFDVDLARTICADLKLACTIQARPFITLIDQIRDGKDDALIAAVVDSPATRATLDFTAPYYTTPARFVARTDGLLNGKGPNAPSIPATPDGLAGHVVGVESGTAHEAYLRTFFPTVKIKSLPDQSSLREALRKGDVEAMFSDGIASALWLNGTDAQNCCAFRGGPFTESRYFGNGVSIAVKSGNVALRQALDYELIHLEKNGTYADLYLKYFPIGFY